MYTALFKKLTSGGESGSLKSTLTTSKSNDSANSMGNKVQYSTGTITPAQTMSVTLDNSTAMDLTPGEAQVSRAEAKREKVLSNKKKRPSTKARLMYGGGSQSSKGKVGKSGGSTKAKSAKGKSAKRSGTKQSAKKKTPKSGKKKAPARKSKSKSAKPKRKPAKSGKKSNSKSGKPSKRK